MRKRNSGFSLIEIIVVLAIISLLVVSISQKINKNSNRTLRRDVRVFGAELRDLRNKARIQGRTFRFVINMPEAEGEKQTYWVESSSRPTLVTYDEDLLKKQKENLKEGEKDPSGFEVDQQVSKDGPQSLPESLYFKSVEIAAQKKEFTSGRIYIHFFPEGRVEEAVIHITNRERLNWALAIHPLTGRVDIIGSEKKLKDLQQ